MINENFAERLFVDLKNAGIKIEKPIYVLEGAKIGSIENSFQFHIIGRINKYNFNVGVAADIQNVTLTFTEAYQQLLDEVKKLKHIKFYSLVIPKGAVVKASLDEFEKVVSRYIQDYVSHTDELMERWDILIQEIKNA